VEADSVVCVVNVASGWGWVNLIGSLIGAVLSAAAGVAVALYSHHRLLKRDDANREKDWNEKELERQYEALMESVSPGKYEDLQKRFAKVRTDASTWDSTFSVVAHKPQADSKIQEFFERVESLYQSAEKLLRSGQFLETRRDALKDKLGKLEPMFEYRDSDEHKENQKRWTERKKSEKF